VDAARVPGGRTPPAAAAAGAAASWGGPSSEVARGGSSLKGGPTPGRMHAPLRRPASCARRAGEPQSARSTRACSAPSSLVYQPRTCEPAGCCLPWPHWHVICRCVARHKPHCTPTSHAPCLCLEVLKNTKALDNMRKHLCSYECAHARTHIDKPPCHINTQPLPHHHHPIPSKHTHTHTFTRSKASRSGSGFVCFGSFGTCHFGRTRGRLGSSHGPSNGA
jgi:hypothetical protein